ncbi:response regulator [Pleurocapsa sp. PCC 7319]|uniref:response regulator n=1 Tax=Pleurocapsa sp. PCC 7319 TaxID=118161 RepID=UPI0003487418|nr:response regulator [Pleurocapsa sp. PCC 7319]
MKNLPSVLLIDDETGFQEAFTESLKAESKKKLFQLELASSGKQGLAIINKNNKQGRKTFAFIDIILPDLQGDKLIEEVDRENNNTKGILISAHKSDLELKQITNKYDWLIDSISKPLNKDKLKNAVNSFIGNSDLSTFNYASLDQGTAEFLLQETKEIKSLMKRTVEGIIETGERLQRVKQRLQHGEFMTWVENEIKCHYSTALHFMRVWETFGEQKEQIADVGINVSVLYLLSAPSMPEQLRTEIVEMAKAGNPVSFAEAKRLKKEYTARESNDSLAEKQESITTIDVTANSESAQLKTSQLKSSEKQQIVGIIPKAKPEPKFWNLGKHLLYCGSAQDPEFRDILPETVSLNVGFPDSQFWSKEFLFTVDAKSTLIFHSVFQDLDLVTLRNIIKNSIELCTESEDKIVFSFLPYPEMLVLADNLKCQCFVAESDFKRCQDVVIFWKSLHNQS